MINIKYEVIDVTMLLVLQEQMEVMRSNEERMKKQVRELSIENKKYFANLQSNEESIKLYSHQLANYEKDKLSLIVSIFNCTRLLYDILKASFLTISEYQKKISNYTKRF